MKKLLVTAAVVALLAGACAYVGIARAQTNQASASVPHKIGLIDMAEVFKGYEKFKTLRKGLEDEIEQTNQQMMVIQKKMNALAEEMQTLKKDSPEFVDREKEILKYRAQLQLLKTETQRDLARRESQVYRTVYLEVEEAVGKYAQYYKYTLVLRFNREGLVESDEPPMVIQKLNRLVVYHEAGDDITDSVVAYLNRKYTPAAGGN